MWSIANWLKKIGFDSAALILESELGHSKDAGEIMKSWQVLAAPSCIHAHAHTDGVRKAYIADVQQRMSEKIMLFHWAHAKLSATPTLPSLTYNISLAIGNDYKAPLFSSLSLSLPLLVSCIDSCLRG